MRTSTKKVPSKMLAMMIAIVLIVAILPVTVFASAEEEDNVYETALAVAADPLATAEEIAAQKAILTAYIENKFLAAGDNSLLALEELRAEYGAISIEAYNIGQGFLLEPSLYSKAEEKSAGDITIDLLTEKGLNYSGSSSYFSGFEFDDSVEAIYPAYLQSYLDDGEVSEQNDESDGYLGEFDYSMYGGWCFTINDWWASYGASDAYPGQEISDYNTGEQMTLGDIIRWHFTVYGYGVDCGFANNAMAESMGGNLFIQEDKSDLIFALAAINDYYGNSAASEENPDVECGDANGDGTIDSTDLVIFTTALLRNEDVNDAFDLNSDGAFNILDLIRLKKIIVGIVGK